MLNYTQYSHTYTYKLTGWYDMTIDVSTNKNYCSPYFSKVTPDLSSLFYQKLPNREKELLSYVRVEMFYVSEESHGSMGGDGKSIHNYLT